MTRFSLVDRPDEFIQRHQATPLTVNLSVRRNQRMVGYISLALAAILVLSGLQMLKNMILRDGGAVDEFPLLGMKFFYLDLTGLVLFCVFLGLAIMAARRRERMY